MGVSLQQLFNQFGAALTDKYPLPSHMLHAMERISRCRTMDLGGHVHRCPNGHFTRIAYNSCLHRSCPQCAWLPRERWLVGWKQRFLPVGHHHVVFTIPHLLNSIWRYNRREFANVLFDTVSETLLELLSDGKYLGARPGILTAQRTWNQKLLPHIHLHTLVTAGGLGSDGQWVLPKKRCLLPRQVLMLKFRGKFLFKLKQAYFAGKIRLPRGVTDGGFCALVSDCRSKVWNVKIHDRYDHAAGIATYLARYVKGGPMGRKRLLAVEEGRVQFKYRKSKHEGGDGKEQGTDSLPVEAFLLRWLDHVPPRRLQTVRGYGLYSGNQHSQHGAARASLGLLAIVGARMRDRPRWQDLVDAAGWRECRCWPKCGSELEVGARVRGSRSPPRFERGRTTHTPTYRAAQEVA